jgi:hypothetical protein
MGLSCKMRVVYCIICLQCGTVQSVVGASQSKQSYTYQSNEWAFIKKNDSIQQSTKNYDSIQQSTKRWINDRAFIKNYDSIQQSTRGPHLFCDRMHAIKNNVLDGRRQHHQELNGILPLQWPLLYFQTQLLTDSQRQQWKLLWRGCTAR